MTRGAWGRPVLVALLGACGEGEGTVRVTAYGESFIEDGIPASAMDDGWAVAFERFEVVTRDVRVAGADIAVVNRVDLAEPSNGAGHELGRVEVRAGGYADASFVVERIELDGAAALGDLTKTFRWAIDAPTAYESCEARMPVVDGEVATFQITVHADHLFYDSLVAEEPRVLFQAMSNADTDQDGEITSEELGVASIGSYDPGSDGGVEDLWSWLVAATRSLPHANGEGHCEAAIIASD